MQFDPSASNAENVKAIFEHLQALDPELGPLLARHLDPDVLGTLTDQERRALRTQIAAEARELLDSQPPVEGGKS